VAQIKVGEAIVGNRVKAKIVKNKVAAPFKVAEFDIYYNEGISRASEAINLGTKEGLIKKTGSTLQYGDIKLGVGMEKAKEFLKENPKILKDLQKEIIEKAE
jgi:recombination protein RecA